MAKNNPKEAYRIKKKRKKIGFWTKLVVLIIAGYFVMAFFQQSVERRELAAEMDRLHQEKAEIEARLEDLEAILEKGDTDEAIEKLARENLTMLKPGERIYILDPKNTIGQELRERRREQQEEDESEEESEDPEDNDGEGDSEDAEETEEEQSP
jgi:cell division protein FtsB